MGTLNDDTNKVKTDSDSLSFGRYLRALRFEKGISLEELSWETKIGVDILFLIENEDHEKLPAEVYVKGFLRAYASIIGADGDVIVRKYVGSQKKFQKATKSEADLKRSDMRFWPRFLSSLGALICIMALSIFSTHIFRDQPQTDEPPAQQNMQVKHQETIPESALPDDTVDSVDKSGKEVNSQSIEKQSVAKENSEQRTDIFLLKIKALEESWMKIIVDNQSPKEYTLKAGDRLELEASSGYSLLIGNAGGINLMLNDKPVKIPGRRGQVVTIQIP